MIEKQIIHAVLSRIREGAVKVTYWDGTTITYGDARPKIHIKFKSIAAGRAILKNMTLGFGEGYMDGNIEIDGPLNYVGKLASDNAAAFKGLAMTKLTRLPSLNRKDKQQAQIQHHYDLGNDFYKLWLDKSMTYSCAYFNVESDSLEQAQEQKRRHLLNKLQLKAGMTVLDIGSGWGTLLIMAAKEYGVSGLGITLSEEQYQHSLAEAKRQKVEDKVKFELINYQDLAHRGRQFDRVISVGMYEHVGRHNQDQYFSAVDKMLKPGGISVLHTIFGMHRGGMDPWIDKYIFPGGYIPGINSIVTGMADRDFRLIDFENLRLHYALTLEEWWKRYEDHKAEVVKMYDKRFYRMWRFYLASSAAGFRFGDLELGQFVFTKGANNSLPLTREFLYSTRHK